MRVIITAGGTGGHIYPALGIINKIKELDKNSDILYIGTHNRMEKDIIPKNNIKYIPIEIYGLSKTDIKRDIKNIFLIKNAIKKCKNIMKEFKPDIVIGVGGYVTFPVIYAAHSLNIKTFIHEQNSIPGKSNRLLENIVDGIGVSFLDSKKYFKKQNKVYYTGNPCSENAINIKPITKKSLGLDNKKLILIVSGSLGSKTVNDKMIDFLKTRDDKYNYIYITGNSYYDEFNKNIFPKNIYIYPFIDNLSGLMKNTDVIISRAGASSISEILALNIPNILIPSPYVANNHQVLNAISLKNNKCSYMIEEKDLNNDILDKYIKLCLDKNNKEEMINNMKNIAVYDSSTRIYNIIKDIIK